MQGSRAHPGLGYRKGIPIHLQERIFDDYTQLGNEERNPDKGLGLGLPICRRSATLLSTRIGLRSTVGRGSVFWIDLPLAQGSVEAPAFQVVGPAPTSAVEVALLVSPDQSRREEMAAILATANYQAVVAASCEEATALYLSAAIDIVLCDIAADPLDFARRLRRLFPALPIFFTQPANGAETETVASGSAEEFVVLKTPLKPARLRAALAAARMPEDP